MQPLLFFAFVFAEERDFFSRHFHGPSAEFL